MATEMNSPLRGRHTSKSVLIADILIGVLCHCDILTVLTASLVSRSFYTMSTSKAVWLALLSDLQRRGFIDLAPEQSLYELSTQGLVDLVKRAVVGPESWLASDSTTVIAPVRQIVLTPSFISTSTPVDGGSQQILLQGGNFLLLRYDDRDKSYFECMDVRMNRRIWAYEGHADRWSMAFVKSFAAQVIDEGKGVNILLGLRTNDEIFPAPRRNFIELINLDLTSGSSASILLAEAPASFEDNPFLRLEIQGDFALAYMLSRGLFLVAQISTALVSTFHLSPSYRGFTDAATSLVSGYILAMQFEHDSTLDGNLVLWHADALLSSSGTQHEAVNVDSIKCALKFPVTLHPPERPNPLVLYLDTFPSPIFGDSSTLWINFRSSYRNGLPTDVQVHKYRIRHSPSQPPAISPISSWKYLDSDDYGWRDGCTAAHSGFRKMHHGFATFGEGEVVFSPAGKMTQLSLPNAGEHLHISPYSHALTYSTTEEIIIQYYD